MKKTLLTALAFIIVTYSFCEAGFLDNLLKGIGRSQQQEPDSNTVIAGLKEALSIGTGNAVSEVSKVDGYLANEAIRILMPEKVQKVADILGKIGYQKQVDDFISSMNRAAEKAAPVARSYFVDAIKEMTIEDAGKILKGGNTAATDYFRGKTFDRLYTAFKPVVSSSMNEVGVTRSYRNMMEKYASMPFVKEESVDLDHYVSDKALNGLFFMIAREEEKIRTDPAARVTELLKKVFGG